MRSQPFSIYSFTENIQPFYVSTFTLPIFPLPEVFLFPGTFLPLHIFETRYRMMLDFCIENGGYMGIAPYQRGMEGGNQVIETIFGWGNIIQKESLPDGRSNIILEGIGTAKLFDYRSTKSFRIANVFKIDQDNASRNDPEFVILLDELLQLTKRILYTESADESLIMKMNHIQIHPFPIDFLASMLCYGYELRQDLLSTTNLIIKANKLLNIVRALNMRE